MNMKNNSTMNMFKEHSVKGAYTTPLTSLVSVTTECGICAGSKDKVVMIDDNNTTTTIERQTGGDDFTISDWD